MAQAICWIVVAAAAAYVLYAIKRHRAGWDDAFLLDRRWWQMSLGIRRESDRAAFANAHGLGDAPAYYLIRPGGRWSRRRPRPRGCRRR
jgi:hypothetical protein